MSLTIQGKKSAGALPMIPVFSDSENWANAGCRSSWDLYGGNPNISTDQGKGVTTGRGGYMACYAKDGGHAGQRCSDQKYASAYDCSTCDSDSKCEISAREKGNGGSSSHPFNTWVDGWLPYVRRQDTQIWWSYDYDFQRHSRSVTRDAANKDICELEINYDVVDGYGLPQDGFQGFRPSSGQKWSANASDPVASSDLCEYDDRTPGYTKWVSTSNACTCPLGSPISKMHDNNKLKRCVPGGGVDANGWRTGFDIDNVQCAGDTTNPANEHQAQRTCNFKAKSGGSQAQVSDACTGETAGGETASNSCKIKCQYEPETFKPRMNIFYQRASEREGNISAGSCIPTSDTPLQATLPGSIQSCAVHIESPTCNGDNDCVWIPRNAEQHPHGIDLDITDKKCMRRNKHGVYPGYYCTSKTGNVCSDTVTEPQVGPIAGTAWTRVIDATGAMTYTTMGPVTTIPASVTDAEAELVGSAVGVEGQITGTTWTRVIDTTSGAVSYTTTELVTVTVIPEEVLDAEKAYPNSMEKIKSKLGECFYTGDIPASRIMFDENEIKKRVAIISKYKEKFIPHAGEGSHCNYGAIMADFCQNIDASYKRGGEAGETDPNPEKGLQSFYSSRNPALHGGTEHQNICKTWYTSTKGKTSPLQDDMVIPKSYGVYGEATDVTKVALAAMNDDHNDWLSGDCDGYGITSHDKMDDSIKAVCTSLVDATIPQASQGKGYITNPENLDRMCHCLKKTDRADYYLPYTTPNTPEYHADPKCWNSGCMLGNDELTYQDDKTQVECPAICIAGIFISDNTAGNNQTFNVAGNDINVSCPPAPTGAHCLYALAGAISGVSSVATDDGSRCTLDTSKETCTVKDPNTYQCQFAGGNSQTNVVTPATPATPGGAAAADADAGATDDAAADAAAADADADAAAAAAAADDAAAAAKATKLNVMLFAGLAAAILVPWFVWLFIPAPWWLMLIISVVAIVVVYTRYKREKKKST